jgi:RNA polymerase sigma-70 factor (ECF subfamily)
MPDVAPNRGVGDAVEGAFRAEWGRVLAAVARWTGDLDLAEESTSEAFASALRAWARDGVPDRPGGWLTTTARRLATDRLRRRGVEREKVATAARLAERIEDAPPASGAADPDEDLLGLLFACCHPALPLEGRVALTLRSLTGMTTAQVARAFLVPEATMAQRLVRTKKRIVSTGISFRIPSPALRRERVSAVLAVLYVLFTEGYDAWAEPVDAVAGAVERRALADDAIRLARLVAGLMSEEPEARGLLALLLLQHARRHARLGPDGIVRTLAEQDRSAWRREEIDEGLEILDAALAYRRPGPYQVQAAIAALHSDSPGAEATDWVEILALYDVLTSLTESPVVRLNRAVALAEVAGPESALAELDAIDAGTSDRRRAAAAGPLDGYHLLPAVRADLLRRLGRTAEATEAYRRAVSLVDREGDRRLLIRQLAQLDSSPESETSKGCSGVRRGGTTPPRGRT